MVDLKDFISLVEELSLLYQKVKEEEERLRIERESRFSILCGELRSLYGEEKSRVYHEYIEPFIDKYSFLKEKSFLIVTEKHKKETCHSLFLKYIWNNQTKSGNIIFRHFLEEIGIKDSSLDTIKSKSYIVKEEHYTREQRKIDLNGKWIDLFFVDNSNKWLVAVENKIKSEVRYYDEKRKRSQLDVYREYCEFNPDYKGYSKVYVLLSYNEKNRSHLRDKWEYADYYQLFRSLFLFRLKDVLLQDYLKTLFSLLFPEMRWEDTYEDVSLYRCMLFYNNVISKIQ